MFRFISCSFLPRWSICSPWEIEKIVCLFWATVYTKDLVWSHFQTLRKGNEIWCTAGYFWWPWRCLEIWSRFWSKLKLRRKWRNKMVKMYANWDQTSKHWHVHWLPLFKLDELLRCLSGYMNGVLVYTGSKKMPFCISIFHPSCLLGIWFMRYLRQIKVDHQVP